MPWPWRLVLTRKKKGDGQKGPRKKRTDFSLGLFRVLTKNKRGHGHIHRKGLSDDCAVGRTASSELHCALRRVRASSPAISGSRQVLVLIVAVGFVMGEFRVYEPVIVRPSYIYIPFSAVMPGTDGGFGRRQGCDVTSRPVGKR